MTLKLPKSGKEMQDWEWKDYEPYFDYLLNQEVNKQNIEEWMKYWSKGTQNKGVLVEEEKLVINPEEQVLTGDEGGISTGYGGILVAENGKIHGNHTRLKEALK